MSWIIVSKLNHSLVYHIRIRSAGVYIILREKQTVSMLMNSCACSCGGSTCPFLKPRFKRKTAFLLDCWIAEHSECHWGPDSSQRLFVKSPRGEQRKETRANVFELHCLPLSWTHLCHRGVALVQPSHLQSETVSRPFSRANHVPCTRLYVSFSWIWCTQRDWRFFVFPSFVLTSVGVYRLEYCCKDIAYQFPCDSWNARECNAYLIVMFIAM